MCVASDPGGVSKASLTYSTTVDGCLSGSTVSSGVTIYLTGLPDPMTQTLSGDANGKVLATLPLIAQLKGPLGCYGYSGGIKCTGEPQGDTLEIKCTGENWSSSAANKSATKTLAVDLQQQDRSSDPSLCSLGCFARSYAGSSSATGSPWTRPTTTTTTRDDARWRAAHVPRLCRFQGRSSATLAACRPASCLHDL